MVQKKRFSASQKKSITLRDVVNHVEHMGQRLSSEVKDLNNRLTGRIDGLEVNMKSMEVRLTQRMDSLQEDLEATIHDTMKIKKHVGMPVSEEF